MVFLSISFQNPFYNWWGWGGSWIRWPPEVLSNFNHSVVLSCYNSTYFGHFFPGWPDSGMGTPQTFPSTMIQRVHLGFLPYFLLVLLFNSIICWSHWLSARFLLLKVDFFFFQNVFIKSFYAFSKLLGKIFSGQPYYDLHLTCWTLILFHFLQLNVTADFVECLLVFW